MTNDEIDALWDRVAHRYGIDQRDVDWLGLRAGWYQMAMLNAALLTPKAPILQLAAADGAGSAPPPQCTGPFTDARDCPVHDPRKHGAARGRLVQDQEPQ